MNKFIIWSLFMITSFELGLFSDHLASSLLARMGIQLLLSIPAGVLATLAEGK
jgi:hypothetical protein